MPVRLGRLRVGIFSARHPLVKKLMMAQQRNTRYNDMPPIPTATMPDAEAIPETYSAPQMSNVRLPVFWGGLFDTSRATMGPPPRYGSPSGYKYDTTYASLPKLRCFGESEHVPELVIITGGQSGRRLGKGVTMDHLLKNYTLLDRIRFPVFIFSKGDEVHLKHGIDTERYHGEIEEWRTHWRSRNGKSEYVNMRLPNVEALGPPYKSGEILDECDNVMYTHPRDFTRELFLSMTMLGGGTQPGTTAQPKYMTLATDVERLIRDQGAGKSECEEFIDRWIDEHEESADKRAGKKLRGAVNDLYGGEHKEGVLRSDAPTIEELIMRRRAGYPFVYVINFKNYEDGDRYFGEHIIGAISRVNTSHVQDMIDLRYVPPVVVIDEAVVFVPNTGDRVVGNRIVEYIAQEGYCSGPTVLIGQDKSQFDRRIIDSEGKGMWTHLFELFPGHKAIYKSKLQTADFVDIPQPGGMPPLRKRINQLSQEEVDKYMRQPKYYSIMAYVKPPELYLPTIWWFLAFIGIDFLRFFIKGVFQ